MKPSDDSALHLPLASAGLSEAFTKTALVNGYGTLDEILQIPLTELAKMEWFTIAMFEELSGVIKK